MRGGTGDPFDPNGGHAEPTSFVVIAWASVAGVAMLLALVAVFYGSPDQNVATAPIPGGEVDMTPTGAIAGGADRVGVIPQVDRRSDIVSLDGGGDRLGQDLARLQVENAALRQTVNAMRSQIDMLSERLGTVERRFSEITGSVGGQSTPAPVRVTPMPLPIEEGDRSALASPQPRPTATQFGLELGSFSDLTALKTAWRALRDAHPDHLAGLDAVAAVRERAGAMELLLVAGPFPNAADAAARCEAVEKAGQACLPAFFLGQPLMIP